MPDPDGPTLHLAIRIESDEDRRILRDVIASARAAELLKSHYVTRRAARDQGRRVPASELELPAPMQRRLELLDRLTKALGEGEVSGETG